MLARSAASNSVSDGWASKAIVAPSRVRRLTLYMAGSGRKAADALGGRPLCGLSGGAGERGGDVGLGVADRLKAEILNQHLDQSGCEKGRQRRPQAHIAHAERE